MSAGQTLEAPLLSSQEIRQELERIFVTGHRSSVAALYGRGERGVVTVRAQAFEVIPTRCELELRGAMPLLAEEESPRICFLVDWAERLPLDLSCRFAHGRMFRIGKDTRLAGLFGARWLDPALLGTGLATVLLGGDAPEPRKIPGQMLHRADAYRRFLEAKYGLPLEGELTAARIAAWAFRNADGPSLVHAAEAQPAWATLRSELRALVLEEGGPLGEAFWVAWEANRGQDALGLAAALEALLPEIGESTAIGALVRGVLPLQMPIWGPHLLAAAGKLRDGRVLDEVFAELDRHEALRPAIRATLERAEAWRDEADLKAALGRSGRLPAGQRRRKEDLNAAVLELVRKPDAAKHAAVLDAFATLRAHRLEAEESEGARGRRMMLVRLCGYLVERSGEAGAARGADFDEALDLAAAYARVGGFVDLARQAIRDLPDALLRPAATELLARIDVLRDEDDRRFAAGLVRWLEAEQPTTRVLPISLATKALVAELLSSTGCRLAVVLMDGMSWANAVELMPGLAEEENRWGPVVWRPSSYASLPAGSLPPVLAALPTLTQISRASFFAGKMVAPTSEEVTREDIDRWAQNRFVKKLVPEDRSPRLLLHDKVLGQGGLHEEARALLGSEDAVVALVVNTIDDQIKVPGGQSRMPCTVETIGPLREILALAAAAGRAVLLIADHGHALGVRMESQGGRAQGGHRWRPLREGEEPRPFEVRLPTKGTWRPRSAAAVAAIWDSRACYGRARHGEHGGISLAEVVCPALLIFPAAGVAAEAAPELRTIPFETPDWWRLAPLRAEEQAPPPVAGPSRRKPRENANQTGFQAPGFEPSSPGAGLSQGERLVGALRGSAVFQAHVRDLPKIRVEEAVLALAAVAEAGDLIAEAELARRCNLPVFRVAGLLSRMAEVVNHDGYAVLEHDRTGQQVRLNRKLLKQLFEVKDA